MLSAAGHSHDATTAPPAVAMLLAHVVAIGTGTLHIAAGDRLYNAVSRAVRAVRIDITPVAVAPAVMIREAEQPLRSALLLAASVSHRGPPVSR
jgi:hypothetical protein